MTVDRDSRIAAWTFAGMVIGFKVVTSVFIFVMEPTARNAVFQLVMNIPVFLLPLPLLVLPAMFWYRLRRVRARRRELIRAEWQVDPELDWNPATARGTMWKR